MEDLKTVYRFKENSKRVFFSAGLMCLSGAIGLIFSNVGYFAILEWRIGVIAVVEFLFAAMTVATMKKKVPFSFFGGMLIIWAIFHYLFGGRINMTVELLSLLSGILLILMAYGILTTKIFIRFTSVLNITIAIILFIDVFRRFFFVDYALETPPDSAIYGFAITEVRNIGGVLITIALALCIGAIQKKEISIVSKVKEQVQSSKFSPVSSPTEYANMSKRFCSYCGKEIIPQAVICPHCGCAVAAPLEADIPSSGLNVLAFLIPLAGLILYCVYQDKKPNKAKAIGKWAIIGFCVGLSGSILLYIILLL